MRKLLFILVFALAGFAAQAQFITPIAAPVWYKKLKVDGLFWLSVTDTSGINAADYPGALVYQADAKSLFVSDSTEWKEVGSTPDLSGLLAKADSGRAYVTPRGLDSVAAVKLNSVDTSYLHNWVGTKIDTVATIERLEAYTGDAQTMLVTDLLRGGLFYRSDGSLTADSGIVFNASDGKYWVRNYDRNIIQLAWFGLRGDGRDETNLFRLAIKSVKANQTLFINNPISYYLIDSALSIPANGITILGQSAISTKIVQSNWGYPIFDCFGRNDVTLKNLNLSNGGIRSSIPNTEYRGTDSSSYCAGIIINGDSCSVSNIYAKGFVAGVFLSNWNSVDSFSVNSKYNYISNITVDSVDYGLLATGQDYATYNNIRGTYINSQTGDPSHLVYLANRSISHYVTLTDCYAINGIDGTAYQIKRMQRGRFSNLNAYKCAGILSLQDCVDNGFFNVTSLSDTLSPDATFSVFMLNSSGGNNDNIFDNIKIIQDSANTNGGITVDGSNNTFNNVVIKTGVIGANAYVNRINSGTHNHFNDIRIDASTSSGGATAMGVISGDSDIINNIIASNVTRLVFTASGVENCAVSYKPQFQNINSTRWVLFTDSSNVMDKGVGVTYYTASGGAMNHTIDASSTDLAIIQINDNSNFTIANPVEAYIGNTLSIELINNTSGNLGTISTGSKLLFTPLAPSAGQSTLINLKFDGNNWVEIGRNNAITSNGGIISGAGTLSINSSSSLPLTLNRATSNSNTVFRIMNTANTLYMGLGSDGRLRGTNISANLSTNGDYYLMGADSSSNTGYASKRALLDTASAIRSALVTPTLDSTIDYVTHTALSDSIPYTIKDITSESLSGDGSTTTFHVNWVFTTFTPTAIQIIPLSDDAAKAQLYVPLTSVDGSGFDVKAAGTVPPSGSSNVQFQFLLIK